MLMPYFDMLQFYESLKEQVQTSKNICEIYESLNKICEKIKKPTRLGLTEDEINEI